MQTDVQSGKRLILEGFLKKIKDPLLKEGWFLADFVVNKTQIYRSKYSFLAFGGMLTLDPALV